MSGERTPEEAAAWAADYPQARLLERTAVGVAMSPMRWASRYSTTCRHTV
jgi:hypothetical protein